MAHAILKAEILNSKAATSWKTGESVGVPLFKTASLTAMSKPLAQRLQMQNPNMQEREVRAWIKKRGCKIKLIIK